MVVRSAEPLGRNCWVDTKLGFYYKRRGRLNGGVRWGVKTAVYTTTFLQVGCFYSVVTNALSSCAAHSTKATRTVRGALLQQSLAGNKCYRAEERITEPYCQGEEGRARNDRQSKKNNEQNIKHLVYMQGRKGPLKRPFI